MPLDGIFGGGRQISGGAKGNARHSAKPPIAADAAFRTAPLAPLSHLPYLFGTYL
ncbi:hypothetical protein [Neisseria meningitidis]|uniref:hypothetical protein n=1 Tax=Neisseria meningitidis TaxID=487 RepID=UPI0002D4190F|nr:hypothetical protein [Neisseria meningitidis]